jgi:inner membrane protein
VKLRSSWPHPSFSGAFLPSSRELGPDGFQAEWRASEYGRQLPAYWLDGDGPGLRALGGSLFGVELLVGIDAYRSVERATKYGILIVALVFMTFFLFEVLAGAQIHPFQYGLVGVGIALFFVLLLALSEVLAFRLAYLVASGGIVLLLSLYTLSVLRSQRRALLCTFGLGGCFGLLYVILQAEDYALLAGSLALFAALALLMRLTRKIDWYARDVAEKR